MCFALDSWQIARILTLRKGMKDNEKVICSNGMFIVIKKTWVETFIGNVIQRFRKGGR